MATVNKNHVFNIMKAKNCPFYYVSDNGHFIDENDSTDISLDDAIEGLKNTLAACSGTIVKVKISNRNKVDKGTGRSRNQLHYEFNVALMPEKSIGGVDNSATVERLINDNIKLREQILTMQHQKQIDELNRKFEQIEKAQNEKGITGIPVVDGLLANEQVQLAIVEKLTGFISPGEKVQALAGVNSNTEELIRQIETVDPNFETETLPLLAQLAVTKPDVYKQGITFLKGSL